MLKHQRPSHVLKCELTVHHIRHLGLIENGRYSAEATHLVQEYAKGTKSPPVFVVQVLVTKPAKLSNPAGDSNDQNGIFRSAHFGTRVVRTHFPLLRHAHVDDRGVDDRRGLRHA